MTRVQVLTIPRDEFFNALDEFVTMAVRNDPDLLQVLVIHLGQDVDADLLTVEDLAQFFEAKAGNIFTKSVLNQFTS